MAEGGRGRCQGVARRCVGVAPTGVAWRGWLAGPGLVSLSKGTNKNQSDTETNAYTLHAENKRNLNQVQYIYRVVPDSMSGLLGVIGDAMVIILI